MKKILISVLYMVRHPRRSLEVFSLYRLLDFRYRLTIIFSHFYREASYRKKYFLSKKSHDPSSNGISTKRQIIIVMHDGLLHSGGLTDRLKGICTLYSFAKRKDFKFKIYFVFPFKLEKYLRPNIIDWSIAQSQISYDLKSTAVYTWENEKLAGDFLDVCTTKKQLHIGCNSDECFSNYSELFHELFKPSPFLTNELKYHLEKLGGCGNYISISLRFQNLLGEFKEWNSASLSKDDSLLLIEKCLCAIEDLKNQYKNVKNILVTSDSNIFRERATSAYAHVYTYILPEEIGHIDYAGIGKAKELTAFLDMFLIAKASKAYQIRTVEMYNSDFPKMAARINQVPYEMILIS